MKIEKLFGLSEAPFTSIQEYTEWSKQMEKMYPFRFGLFLMVNQLIENSSSIETLAHNLKWWLTHRLCPMHRYHVIKMPQLKPGYHDPDEQIFHATMSIVTRYYENCSNSINWEDTEEHKKVYKIIKDAYDWYNRDRPMYVKELDTVFSSDYSMYSTSNEYVNEAFAMEDALKNVDDKVLHNIISIRRHLWCA